MSSNNYEFIYYFDRSPISADCFVLGYCRFSCSINNYQSPLYCIGKMLPRLFPQYINVSFLDWQNVTATFSHCSFDNVLANWP